MMYQDIDSGSQSTSTKSDSNYSSVKLPTAQSKNHRLQLNRVLKSKENKFRDRLFKPKAIDNTRRHILLPSCVRVNSIGYSVLDKNSPRSEQSEASDNNAILELVDLIDKGKLLKHKTKRLNCACCSCCNLQTHTHTIRHQLQDYPYSKTTLTSGTSMISKKRLICDKTSRLRYKAKSIKSDPCTCTSKISGVLNIKSIEDRITQLPRLMLEEPTLRRKKITNTEYTNQKSRQNNQKQGKRGKITNEHRCNDNEIREHHTLDLNNATKNDHFSQRQMYPMKQKTFRTKRFASLKRMTNVNETKKILKHEKGLSRTKSFFRKTIDCFQDVRYFKSYSDVSDKSIIAELLGKGKRNDENPSQKQSKSVGQVICIHSISHEFTNHEGTSKTNLVVIKNNHKRHEHIKTGTDIKYYDRNHGSAKHTFESEIQFSVKNSVFNVSKDSLYRYLCLSKLTPTHKTKSQELRHLAKRKQNDTLKLHKKHKIATKTKSPNGPSSLSIVKSSISYSRQHRGDIKDIEIQIDPKIYIKGNSEMDFKIAKKFYLEKESESLDISRRWTCDSLIFVAEEQKRHVRSKHHSKPLRGAKSTLKIKPSIHDSSNPSPKKKRQAQYLLEQAMKREISPVINPQSQLQNIAMKSSFTSTTKVQEKLKTSNTELLLNNLEAGFYKKPQDAISKITIPKKFNSEVDCPKTCSVVKMFCKTQDGTLIERSVMAMNLYSISDCLSQSQNFSQESTICCSNVNALMSTTYAKLFENDLLCSANKIPCKKIQNTKFCQEPRKRKHSKEIISKTQLENSKTPEPSSNHTSSFKDIHIRSRKGLLRKSKTPNFNMMNENVPDYQSNQYSQSFIPSQKSNITSKLQKMSKQHLMEPSEKNNMNSINSSEYAQNLKFRYQPAEFLLYECKQQFSKHKRGHCEKIFIGNNNKRYLEDNLVSKTFSFPKTAQLSHSSLYNKNNRIRSKIKLNEYVQHKLTQKKNQPRKPNCSSSRYGVNLVQKEPTKINANIQKDLQYIFKRHSYISSKEEKKKKPQNSVILMRNELLRPAPEKVHGNDRIKRKKVNKKCSQAVTQSVKHRGSNVGFFKIDKNNSFYMRQFSDIQTKGNHKRTRPLRNENQDFCDIAIRNRNEVPCALKEETNFSRRSIKTYFFPSKLNSGRRTQSKNFYQKSSLHNSANNCSLKQKCINLSKKLRLNLSNYSTLKKINGNECKSREKLHCDYRTCQKNGKITFVESDLIPVNNNLVISPKEQKKEIIQRLATSSQLVTVHKRKSHKYLQNINNSYFADRARICKEMQNRNVYTVLPVLLPYECEPGICVPGDCDPIECYERIKKRRKVCKALETDRPSLRAYGSSASGPLYVATKCQAVTDLPTKTCETTCPGRHAGVYKPRPVTVIEDDDAESVVRVGSSLSFNIEFYKTTGAAPPPVIPEPPIIEIRPKVKTRKCVCMPSKRTKKICVPRAPVRHHQLQSTETESRGTGLPCHKKCRATVALQKNEQRTKCMDVCMKEKLPIHREVAISKDECYPLCKEMGVCTGRYMVDEPIPVRRIKDFGTKPIYVPCPCASSMASIEPDYIDTGIQPIRRAPRREIAVTTEAPRRRFLPRLTRFGSNISINVEFYKKRYGGTETMTPRKFSCAPTYQKKAVATMDYDTRDAIVKCTPHCQSRQTYARCPVAYNEEIQAEGTACAGIGTASGVETFLKRCFCSLNLSRKRRCVPRRYTAPDYCPSMSHQCVPARTCDLSTCQTQADNVKMRDKSLNVNNVLKRCFCTLKFFKNESKSIDSRKPTRELTVNRVSIENTWNNACKYKKKIQDFESGTPKRPTENVTKYDEINKKNTKTYKNSYLSYEVPNYAKKNTSNVTAIRPGLLRQSYANEKAIFNYPNIESSASKKTRSTNNQNHKKTQDISYLESLKLCKKDNIVGKCKTEFLVNPSFDKRNRLKLFFQNVLSRLKTKREPLTCMSKSVGAYPQKVLTGQRKVKNLVKSSKSDLSTHLKNSIGPITTFSLKETKVYKNQRKYKGDTILQRNNKKFSHYQYGDTCRKCSSIVNNFEHRAYEQTINRSHCTHEYLAYSKNNLEKVTHEQKGKNKEKKHSLERFKKINETINPITQYQVGSHVPRSSSNWLNNKIILDKKSKHYFLTKCQFKQDPFKSPYADYKIIQMALTDTKKKKEHKSDKNTKSLGTAAKKADTDAKKDEKKSDAKGSKIADTEKKEKKKSLKEKILSVTSKKKNKNVSNEKDIKGSKVNEEKKAPKSKAKTVKDAKDTVDEDVKNNKNEKKGSKLEELASDKGKEIGPGGMAVVGDAGKGKNISKAKDVKEKAKEPSEKIPKIPQVRGKKKKKELKTQKKEEKVSQAKAVKGGKDTKEIVAAEKEEKGTKDKIVSEAKAAKGVKNTGKVVSEGKKEKNAQKKEVKVSQVKAVKGGKDTKEIIAAEKEEKGAKDKRVSKAKAAKDTEKNIPEQNKRKSVKEKIRDLSKIMAPKGAKDTKYREEKAGEVKKIIIAHEDIEICTTEEQYLAALERKKRRPEEHKHKGVREEESAATAERVYRLKDRKLKHAVEEESELEIAARGDKDKKKEGTKKNKPKYVRGEVSDIDVAKTGAKGMEKKVIKERRLKGDIEEMPDRGKRNKDKATSQERKVRGARNEEVAERRQRNRDKAGPERRLKGARGEESAIEIAARDRRNKEKIGPKENKIKGARGDGRDKEQITDEKDEHKRGTKDKIVKGKGNVICECNVKGRKGKRKGTNDEQGQEATKRQHAVDGKETEGKGSKGKKGKKTKDKACTCGSKVCAKELKKPSKKQKKTKKPCICGTSVCAEESKKFIPGHVCKCELSQKKQDKKALKEKRLQELIEKCNKKKYEAEKRAAKRRKEAEKKKKKERALIDKYKQHGDCTLIAESVVDLVKSGIGTGVTAAKSITNAIFHPKCTYAKLKSSKKGTGLQAKIANSKLAQAVERTRHRTKAMKRVQKIQSKMENTATGHFLLNINQPSNKRAKFKKKRRRKPTKRRQDFECNIFMASLRRHPCLFVYDMCPWCYPQFLSCLNAWRQLMDICLFLLAVGVWSPFIILMEGCRALLCCFFCTG